MSEVTTGRPASEAPRICEFFAGQSAGFFVDVGACEPKAGSQTWLLEERGWSGLLVEAQGRYIERLRAERPRSKVVHAACAGPGHPDCVEFHLADVPTHSSLVTHLVDAGTRYIGTERVRAVTLDELLAEAAAPEVDFVSIDVEGTQFEVLQGFSLGRYRPKLLLIEDHLRNLRTHRHLCRQGYRLVKRTGLNNWYIPAGAPFGMSTAVERLRLWKKVWLNTPFRKLRLWRERRAAARGGR